jgi:hypothetical protein
VNALLFVLGIMLIVMAYLLHEPEEARLLLFLKETAVRLRDAERAASARNRAKFQIICAALLRVVNMIFGSRRVSMRIIWSAFMLTIASSVGFFLLAMLIAHILYYTWPAAKVALMQAIHGDPMTFFRSEAWLFVVVIQLISLAMVPALIDRTIALTGVRALFQAYWPPVLALAIGYLPLKTCTLTLLGAAVAAFSGKLHNVILVLLPFSAGIVLDLIFVGLVRATLMRGARNPGPLGQIALVGLATMAVLMALAPVKLFSLFASGRPLTASALMGPVFNGIFDTLFALALLVMGIGFLAHRLLWQLVDRPIAALHRWGVPRRNLLALGIVLVFVALGRGTSDWKGVIGSFIGGLTKP